MSGTESGVRTVLETAAAVVAGIALATMLLAVLIEAVRDRVGARRLVAVGDRLLPRASRRIAAVIVATVALVLPGGAVAGATPTVDPTAVATPTPAAPPGSAGPLRHWLTRPASPPTTAPVPVPTSTSTTVPVASTTTTTHAAAGRPPRPQAPADTRPIGAAPPSEPSPPPATPPPAAAPAAPPPLTVVMVRPGDCLWTIAAQHLGADATNADIDRAWRAIWAANRDRIGADPNLIHPGLVLAMPVPTVP
jgi:resuscitation-promoting factor RpfA